MKAWVTNVGPKVAVCIESENSAEANVLRELSNGLAYAGCWVQSFPNAAGLTISAAQAINPSGTKVERRKGTDRRNWGRFFK